MSEWLPGYRIIQLGRTGGSYDQRANPKLCWHTTEGSSIGGAESAFYNYPPHICVNPDTGEKHQYIALDRCAYSLGNSEAEDSYVIQVEVVGFAGESQDWSNDRCDWLSENVVTPVAAAVGVPPIPVPQGFHGANEGMVLASPDSPIRLSIGAWDGFAGHVGHQHCPGDDHWDPGRMNIDRILALKPPPRKDFDMTPGQCRDKVGRKWFFVVGDNHECFASIDGGTFFPLGGYWTSGLDAHLEDDGLLVVCGRGGEGALWQLIVYTDGSPDPGKAPVLDKIGGHIFPPS